MSTETAVPSSTSLPAEYGASTLSSQDREDASSALIVRGEDESPQSRTLPGVTVDSPTAGLPIQLDVTVPIPSFRVQDLVGLEKGTVLESHWHHADDVPVWCGGAQLAWTEFEVVDRKLAVRLTRIS